MGLVAVCYSKETCGYGRHLLIAWRSCKSFFFVHVSAIRRFRSWTSLILEKKFFKQWCFWEETEKKGGGGGEEGKIAFSMS